MECEPEFYEECFEATMILITHLIVSTIISSYHQPAISESLGIGL